MGRIKLNQNLIFLYYILLLFIFLSWSNFNTVPGPIIRLIYLGAILIPVIAWKRSWLAPVIILFYTLAKNSYSSSYLPAENYTYITAIIFLLFFSYSKDRIKIPLCILIILIVPFFINLIYHHNIEQISYTAFVVFLLLLSINNNDEKQLSIISLFFILACLILSISYLLYGKYFSMIYVGFEEERIGFSDINYVASIIGFSIILILIKLLYESYNNVFLKSFYIIIVFVELYTLFTNASRGSLLAIGAGVLVLLLFSKTSIKLKILISVAIIGFLVFLYTNSYMDLLFYRIGNDNTTGGTGRVLIWEKKWAAFSTSESILKLLFGFGYVGGRQLSGVTVAFHNDFLAFLVEYGVLGLFIIISFIVTPLIKSNKNNRPLVLASLVYLIAVEFTLEPIAAGRFPFYVIWLYSYIASNLDFRHK